MPDPHNNNAHTLVVLGATGNQGRAVLEYFAAPSSQLNSFKLRGITRNAHSNAALALQNIGVEMVEADLDDLPALQKAFVGATHIFATTDSNQNIFHAIQNPEVLLRRQGATPRSYAREIELKQGENIAEAASATHTLRRLVWSSLPSPRKWSKELYTKVTMFDTKEEILDLFFKAKPGLGEKTSALLVGFYATNALAVPALYGPVKQADGTYELALPMSGNIPVPMADLQADMGKWVDALFDAAPGVTMVGSTEELSWEQWLQLWAVRNGVHARFRRTSPAEYESRIEGISDAVSEEFQFIERFGFVGGNEEVVYPAQLRKNGVPIERSSMKDHVDRCDWSSIL